MKKTARERKERRGFVPFVNVTFKAAKKRREDEEQQQQCVKTPNAIKKRRNATMAFGGTSGEKKKFYPRRRPVREEKESLSEGADSGAGAGGGGETTSEMKEDEDKEDDSKHPDVAWTGCRDDAATRGCVCKRLEGRSGDHRERVSMERRAVLSDLARGFVGVVVERRFLLRGHFSRRGERKGGDGSGEKS
jgi:hypothetical protein